MKGLPREVSADPERPARLQRDAERLAAFNHPHMARIHGLVEAGRARALPMELVERETLAARLAGS